MVEGESIGGPVDMGVEAVEPRLTQDDVDVGRCGGLRWWGG